MISKLSLLSKISAKKHPAITRRFAGSIDGRCSSGERLRVRRKSTATHRYIPGDPPTFHPPFPPSSFPAVLFFPHLERLSAARFGFFGRGTRRPHRRRRCAVAWRYTPCGDLANFASQLRAPTSALFSTTYQSPYHLQSYDSPGW